MYSRMDRELRRGLLVHLSIVLDRMGIDVAYTVGLGNMSLEPY